jgi:hypothetical protein
MKLTESKWKEDRKKERNKEIYDLYFSPNSVREIPRHVAIMGETRNEYRNLAGKLGWQNSNEEQQCLWKDHNKMNLKSIKLEVVDCLKIGTNLWFCAYGIEWSCFIEDGL